MRHTNVILFLCIGSLSSVKANPTSSVEGDVSTPLFLLKVLKGMLELQFNVANLGLRLN